jgi:cytochrome P450
MTSPTAAATDWPRWEDPAFYTQDVETIQAQMAAQREAAPVYRYEAPGLTSGLWVLSTWEGCRQVGSSPELFSNRFGFAIGDANRLSPAVLNQLPEWARQELTKPGLTIAQQRGLVAHGKLSLGDPQLENMMLLDPPRHGQVRKIFMRALRPSLVRSLRSRMAAITDEFIDDLIEPGVEVDFVQTIGRIPAAVMTELVGVPREMREEFIRMATGHFEAITITPDKDPEEVTRINAVAGEFRDYIDELLAERRAAGGEGDDLISVIVRSELDGEPLPRSTAVVFVTHFIGAGETTRTLLSHLAMELGRLPEQRRLLFERPELVANALEETLRFYPPNWTGCRTAIEDVRIGDQTIAKDDFVVMAYAAANRDPDAFERPDEFDIARPFDHDHLSFGHGEHSCPGALLARTDAQAIWERLLDRFEDWELAGAPVTWSNPFLRGVASLPVKFFA